MRSRQGNWRRIGTSSNSELPSALLVVALLLVLLLVLVVLLLVLVVLLLVLVVLLLLLLVVRPLPLLLPTPLLPLITPILLGSRAILRVASLCVDMRCSVLPCRLFSFTSSKYSSTLLL